MADLERFITNYFSYLNECKFNDIFFFGLIKDEDLLFDNSTLKSVVNKIVEPMNNELLKFNVELEFQVLKFSLQSNICYNFRICNGKKYLMNLLMKNIPKNVETCSLGFLSKDPFKPGKNDLEFLANNCENLISVLKAYPNILNKFISHKSLNLIEKKVFYLSSFEYLNLRPLYKIISIFQGDSSIITGKQTFYLLKMIYYFIFNTIYLYENCKNIENPQSNLSKNVSKNKIKEEEMKLLQKIEILEYEDICIKSELDLNTINKFKKDLQKIAKGEIKYFQISEIFLKFSDTCDQIIKIKDNNIVKKPKMEDPLSNKISRNEKKNTNKMKQKIEDLIELYKDTVAKTYDDALAMINVFDKVETNDESDVAKEILQYLTMKISDSLTENNIHSFGKTHNEDYSSNYNENDASSRKNKNDTKSNYLNDMNKSIIDKNKVNTTILNAQNNTIILGKKNNNNSKEINENNKKEINENIEIEIKKNLTYEKGQLKKININKFKFQNAYCLTFLNMLFFHDSARFQGILEENFEAEYEHFFTFLTTDLILPNILNETNKNFELDKMDSIKTSFPNNIAFEAIKFLQNLCENHNQNYQNKFFNHEFSGTVEIIEYPYVNSFSDVESNKKIENNFSRKFLVIYDNFIDKEENEEIEENAHNENLSIIASEGNEFIGDENQKEKKNSCKNKFLIFNFSNFR